jgi:hypothetical protein
MQANPLQNGQWKEYAFRDHFYRSQNRGPVETILRVGDGVQENDGGVNLTKI